MKKTSTNFSIDIVAFIAFVLLTTTGVLMKYILPPGSGRHSTIWGMDRHQWGDIHFWVSVVFFSIIALHVILHWRWIVNVFSRARLPENVSGYRAGLGLVGLVAILAIAVAPLVSPVEKEITEKKESYSESSKHEDYEIRGSMTLQKVENISKVPVSYLIQSLNLPPTTLPEEKLGQLKSRYGFEIDEVRRVVEEYKNQ